MFQMLEIETQTPKKHTPGHIDCPACLEIRAKLLCSISATLPFAEAAAHYLRLRSVASTPGAASARYISDHTETGYKRNLDSCSLFFGSMPLNEIHWYNMKAYQQARVAGVEPFHRYRRPQDAKPQKVNGAVIPAKGKTPCPAKPQQANQELRLVKKLKVMAGCWTPQDEEYFEYLQEEESDVERALSPEEQQRWLDVARTNPRWEFIYLWSVVSFDLLTSTNELRGLPLGNVNLNYQEVRIPWPCAKNRYRRRDIPVESGETLWALDRLIARAHDLGAKEPQHYLFPFKITRSKTSFPDKPMTVSGIKKLWQEVREASGLTWFRPYDTRHTGATRCAESGMPTPVIMARMGHCSLDMQKRYTHISEQAKRMWARHSQGMYQQNTQPGGYTPSYRQAPNFARGSKAN